MVRPLVSVFRFRHIHLSHRLLHEKFSHVFPELSVQYPDILSDFLPIGKSQMYVPATPAGHPIEKKHCLLKSRKPNVVSKRGDKKRDMRIKRETQKTPPPQAIPPLSTSIYRIKKFRLPYNSQPEQWISPPKGCGFLHLFHIFQLMNHLQHIRSFKHSITRHQHIHSCLCQQRCRLHVHSSVHFNTC